MKSWAATFGLLAVVIGTTCDAVPQPAATDPGVCDAPTARASLPEALEETSGAAASRAHAGVFWTHNDSGGEPLVFAVDTTGQVLGWVRVARATNRDWEDIALGPCGPDGGDCLYIADIGDNDERYPHVAVYRFPEPELKGDTMVEATIVRFRYPDGPRDAESIYVTDRGLHVVNKGRSDAIELFRLPFPHRGTDPLPLTRVQQLAPPPTSMSAQVTAAAVAPAGDRVALRTYGGMRFFEVDGDTLKPLGRHADVVAPEQLQGEGVAWLDADRLLVTSEKQGPNPAMIAVVRCDPLRPAADSTAADSTATDSTATDSTGTDSTATDSAAPAQSRNRTSTGT